VTARQGSALDHSLLAHAGPTDIDVAMFHRDAGGGKAGSGANLAHPKLTPGLRKPFPVQALAA